MGGLTNPIHLAFIAMIALIFLGPKRLPELAKSLGSGMREFRDTLSGEREEAPQPPVASVEPAPVPALAVDPAPPVPEVAPAPVPPVLVPVPVPVAPPHTPDAA